MFLMVCMEGGRRKHRAMGNKLVSKGIEYVIIGICYIRIHK